MMKRVFKTIIFVICISTAITSLVTLVSAGLLKWDDGSLKELIERYIKASQTGNKKQYDVSILLDEFREMTGLYMSITFGVSFVYFFASINGMLAAIKKSHAIWQIFILFLSALIIAVLILLIFILISSSLILKPVKTKLDESMSQYVSDTANDSSSSLGNFIMQEWDCCGMNNGSDFERYEKWIQKIIVGNSSYDSLYPQSCCHHNENGSVPGCPPLDSYNSNIGTGCWPKFQGIMDRSKLYICIILSAKLFVLFVLWVLSVWLKYEKLRKYKWLQRWSDYDEEFDEE